MRFVLVLVLCSRAAGLSSSAGVDVPARAELLARIGEHVAPGRFACASAGARAIEAAASALEAAAPADCVEIGFPRDLMLLDGT